ncbi:tRNA (guanosine(46)-N7)-methyltransferase TrmB [Nitratireductor mangrovi]|uniref:tRNA (guanine-N(7)-)-methyltransferase n=1 Tax=Nitratireductor mangrovi TaxID=2599600 RepID=A0A5B8KZU7_9HYPH|nr:tRNA (guanine(46)-N(7))-methyltransferase TrmB [Nitratireductor mangrovi]QDZ01284.1 tRNA (guanosine(46)-N7)-methyltransferase TrmB [Nitratireductor mangrovi]
MEGERGRRSTEAFFGRRKGKTIRPRQAALLDRLLPALLIDLDAPPPPLGNLFGPQVAEVRLEIGFGGGEHFLHESGRHPAVGFIGVEPFVNGMAKFLAAFDEDPRSNIRLYDDDATRLLDWLPSASIASIDLLYPDPWPKKRHWKRRFVNDANLDRFARVLQPGGRFRFASDIDSYVNWTLHACRRHPRFEWQAETAADWRTPYEGWPGTRYEAKAMREGRTPAYLTFLRT